MALQEGVRMGNKKKKQSINSQTKDGQMKEHHLSLEDEAFCQA
jgi:hypothetical protein